MPPQSQRLFDYWAQIVSQATQYDDPTTLRCRNRSGRKPCGALLTMFVDIGNNDVLWFCPCGHDKGVYCGVGGNVLGQRGIRNGKAVLTSWVPRSDSGGNNLNLVVGEPATLKEGCTRQAGIVGVIDDGEALLGKAAHHVDKDDGCGRCWCRYPLPDCRGQSWSSPWSP